MNKISIFILAITAISLISCTEDLGTTEVEYVKAEAIYGSIDDLRNTQLLSTSQEIIDPGKVYVSEDLLLIGEEGKGIHVFDNSDPESPRELYFMNIPENKEFYVADNKIYAESLYDVIKIDISNKQSPTIESRVENAFSEPFKNASGQELIGFTYTEVKEKLDKSSSIWELVNGDDPLFFDYEQRLIPRSNVPASFAGSSGSSIGTVNRIAQKNDHIYVISNSVVYTFKNGSQLEKVSENSIGWNLETIYPQDDALFVGTSNSMEILTITNPDNPEWIGSFSHATSCDPVLPNGETAYVTLRSGNECDGNIDALIVVDIENLTIPQSKQDIEMESPYGMTIIAGQLYVGEGENGLKIFDILDDGRVEMVEHDKSIQAYDVIPHPTKADIILVASPSGFGQYQITSTSRKLLSWISA